MDTSTETAATRVRVACLRRERGQPTAPDRVVAPNEMEFMFSSRRASSLALYGMRNLNHAKTQGFAPSPAIVVRSITRR